MKYLFSALYKDGSVYEQNPEDISIIDPLRSCYFDLKQDEIEKFKLIGDGNTYSVDLTDGHFEVNGIPFLLHEEELKDFRLIFWRRHTHSFNRNDVELSHDIVYRFGWQCTVDGKNYQQIMQIK